MEIKGLFDALAGYLDFFIDMVLLKGMEQYANLGKIDPTLVAYFVVGVFIAYLISAARRLPGYEQHLQKNKPSATPSGTPPRAIVKTDNHTKDPVNTFDMAQFVLLSILGAFLYHGFLIVYSSIIGSPNIYSVKDTLNAIFAYNALYHPLNAFARRVQQGVDVLIRSDGGPAVLGIVLAVGVVIFYFLSIAFLLYPLAAVHDASIGTMLWPSLAFVVVVFAFMALFLFVLGIPLSAFVPKSRRPA